MFVNTCHRGLKRVGRRTAQERVTGGRWRRIVLGDVGPVSGRRGSGSFGSSRTVGMPSGKVEHHPGWNRGQRWKAKDDPGAFALGGKGLAQPTLAKNQAIK